MARILIVDDDRDVRETISSLVARKGHDFVLAQNLAEARDLLGKEDPDLVFLDVRLPDGSGMDFLPELRTAPSHPEAIILTGVEDPDGAELAIKGGAWDYLVKPASVKDISLTLQQVISYRREKQEKCHTVALKLDGMVGESKAIKAIFDKIAMASCMDAGVLVTGETGTGKELIARSIHNNSPRSGGNFVAVDCASLTESLVESSLFGHRKGAFTGAVGDSVGLIKLADNGTLFLDEVGEMPLSLQKAFLRVLQERAYRPVGSMKEIQSDFRVISATNKDLAEMVAKGEFRSDLLFRLKTVAIPLPPLRQRREDIELLIMHRMTELREHYGIPDKGLGEDFLEIMRNYPWPGNVRELFNVIEHAFVNAATEPTLYSTHLPKELRIQVTKDQIKQKRHGAGVPAPTDPASGPAQPSLRPASLPTIKAYKTLAEKRYLEQLIEFTGGELPAMLDISGLSRSHLYAMAKKHGLSF